MSEHAILTIADTTPDETQTLLCLYKRCSQVNLSKVIKLFNDYPTLSPLCFDTNGNSPLMLLLENGDAYKNNLIDMFNVLLNYHEGAFTSLCSIPNSSGTTPLMNAVKFSEAFIDADDNYIIQTILQKCGISEKYRMDANGDAAKHHAYMKYPNDRDKLNKLLGWIGE